MLANIYLHYVFDLWVQHWRKKQAQGDVIVVRWADDFVVGFEHQSDAERFHGRSLAERFAKFELKLHPEKTRVIEFGSFAAEQPKAAWTRASRRHSTFSASRTSAGRSSSGMFTVCGAR